MLEHLQLMAQQHLVLSVFQEVESFMKLMENYLDLVTLHLDLYTYVEELIQVTHVL